MSFRKCKLTLLTRNIAHAEFKCGRNIEKNTRSTLPYSSLEPYTSLSEFYLHRFRLQVLLPMDTHTSSLRRALKLAQEQEVAEDWRWPRNERDRARRAAETSEQRSEKVKAERSC